MDCSDTPASFAAAEMVSSPFRCIRMMSIFLVAGSAGGRDKTSPVSRSTLGACGSGASVTHMETCSILGLKPLIRNMELKIAPSLGDVAANSLGSRIHVSRAGSGSLVMRRKGAGTGHRRSRRRCRCGRVRPLTESDRGCPVDREPPLVGRPLRDRRGGARRVARGRGPSGPRPSASPEARVLSRARWTPHREVVRLWKRSDPFRGQGEPRQPACACPVDLRKIRGWLPLPGTGGTAAILERARGPVGRRAAVVREPVERVARRTCAGEVRHRGRFRVVRPTSPTSR